MCGLGQSVHPSWVVSQWLHGEYDGWSGMTGVGFSGHGHTRYLPQVADPLSVS